MKKKLIIIVSIIAIIATIFVISKYSTYDDSTKNCQYDKDADRLQQQIEGAMN